VEPTCGQLTCAPAQRQLTLELDAETHLPSAAASTGANPVYKGKNTDTEEYATTTPSAAFPRPSPSTRIHNGDMSNHALPLQRIYGAPSRGHVKRLTQPRQAQE